LFRKGGIDKSVGLLRAAVVSVTHVFAGLIPDTWKLFELIKILLFAADSSVTASSVGTGVTLARYTICFAVLGAVHDRLHAESLENLPSVGVSVTDQVVGTVIGALAGLLPILLGQFSVILPRIADILKTCVLVPLLHTVTVINTNFERNFLGLYLTQALNLTVGQTD